MWTSSGGARLKKKAATKTARGRFSRTRSTRTVGVNKSRSEWMSRFAYVPPTAKEEQGEMSLGKGTTSSTSGIRSERDLGPFKVRQHGSGNSDDEDAVIKDARCAALPAKRSAMKAFGKIARDSDENDDAMMDNSDDAGNQIEPSCNAKSDRYTNTSRQPTQTPLNSIGNILAGAGSQLGERKQAGVKTQSILRKSILPPVRDMPFSTRKSAQVAFDTQHYQPETTKQKTEAASASKNPVTDTITPIKLRIPFRVERNTTTLTSPLEKLDVNYCTDHGHRDELAQMPAQHFKQDSGLNFRMFQFNRSKADEGDHINEVHGPPDNHMASNDDTSDLFDFNDEERICHSPMLARQFFEHDVPSDSDTDCAQSASRTGGPLALNEEPLVYKLDSSDVLFIDNYKYKSGEIKEGSMGGPADNETKCTPATRAKLSKLLCILRSGIQGVFGRNSKSSSSSVFGSFDANGPDAEVISIIEQCCDAREEEVALQVLHTMPESSAVTWTCDSAEHAMRAVTARFPNNPRLVEKYQVLVECCKTSDDILNSFP